MKANGELYREAVAAKEKYGTWIAAGKALGVSPSTLRSRVGRGAKHFGGELQTTPGSDELEKYREAADFVAEIPPQIESPAITGGYTERTAEEIWKEAESGCAEKIRQARTREKFKVRFAEPRIAVAFMSDQHIAPGTPCDLTRMREDAELIRRTPGLYCILGGDGTDNHIKHRSAMLSARSTPTEQWQLYEYYLNILGPKLICAVSGNHDSWSAQIAGLDMLGWLGRSNKIVTSSHGAFLEICLGSQEYRVHIRHQYRYNSGFNQTHAIKQMLRMGEHDFDIGVIGHHHEAAMEAFMWRGQRRWACRPGAYQISSDHSAQYGYETAVPTCPTFLLSGQERDIVGFFDVRTATKFI